MLVPHATKLAEITYLSYNWPSQGQSMGGGILGAGGRGLGGRCHLGSACLPTVLAPGVLGELFDDGGCWPIIFKSREPQMLLSHLWLEDVNG